MCLENTLRRTIGFKSFGIVSTFSIFGTHAGVGGGELACNIIIRNVS